MPTRMLIDARHPEETRVAVLKGNRIEEFDFESSDHKQIKGNIYLAKVTRVEPSLQAAFVDFGGNRHGFLAFSEIHPDYYQIPSEDRAALLAEEQEAAEEEARLRAEEEERGEMPGDEYDADDETGESLVEEIAEDGLEEVDDDKDKVATLEEGEAVEDHDDDDDDEDQDGDEKPRKGRGRGRGKGGKRRQGRSRAKEVDEVRERRRALRRRYKIQDVIQRRQVLLVQVVKEERGNKGAALTTYLSLAGRYTVLMPNSSSGGGISRKISNAGDRKRLKKIVGDLSLPKSMGLIVRTAGISRNKTEIKRDFDYLARLWDEIREKTMGSSAPALIHSDSDLIKRAIRDVYNREIEEVLVEGEEGYKAAKQFMKLLMPSHARRVKSYADPVPLFQRYGAEDQLRAMYDPQVQLKSGGYLIINPTEALVSIDINSGRSTKEHGIEQTALHTNLEAAREIARQLRLRDMAGLVVIDFIDMEYNSNVRKVERAMKDALKSDRARIQVGRISGFGLMEMSRQRLRTGVLEATTRECPHCDGTGLVRTASSSALSALRLIEDEAAKGKGTVIKLYASQEATIYLLNDKRSDLAEIEERYGVTVHIMPEGEDEGAKMRAESTGPKPSSRPKFEPIVEDDEPEDEIEDYGDEDEDDDDDDRGGRGRGRKKRSRRGGGRGRNRNQRDRNDDDGDDSDDDDSSDDDTRNDDNRNDGGRNDDEDEDGKPKKRRRRGRRGGRGRGKKKDTPTNEEIGEEAENLEQVSEQLDNDIAVVSGPEGEPVDPEAAAEQDKPKRTRRKPAAKKASAAKDGDDAPVQEKAEEKTEEKPKRTRRKKSDDSAEAATEEKPKGKRAPRKKKADAEEAPADEAKAEEKPKRTRRKPAAKKAETEAAVEAAPTAGEPAAPTGDKRETEAAKPTVEDKPAKPRRGWWQRTFGE
ncbi:Rne/Rng family ribonuclease [Pseudoblastomonas halimionae]|uniref:Ribonuclease E n=1 Tax=Alteriqipengyuania halimionae TaxID=1926630 RepID=A0A6I4U0D4_9SPHN|nr:ribonuclease E/G [Alteriqipengyuania halimionae]MXP09236.1 Rne/Rng family ribonuclease [Alteriqipengyuania halimionae]